MIVLVHTDHNIENLDGLSARITRVVKDALSHRSNNITRVEVHVSDEDSDKKHSGGQMRCVLEARLEGRGPLAVTNHDATVLEATVGAVHKLVKLIDHTLDRANDLAPLRT